MAYQPINLAEIYANIDRSNAMKQQSELTGLQLTQAKKGIADQQTIDTAIANPNATTADYAKAGLAGLQAQGQKQQLDFAQVTNQYRALYTKAKQVAGAEDPLQAAMQVSPETVQAYDQTHGPGAFAQLPPDQSPRCSDRNSGPRLPTWPSSTNR